MRNSKALARVSLTELRAYLASSGWIPVVTSSDRWEVFRRERGGGSGIELILPLTESKVDANDRIASAVSALAQLEGRTLDDVCTRISGSNTDSIMFKLLVGDDDRDAIPLDDASRHVKALRDLLLYGACSELDPRPHFEQPLPAARGLTQGFQFCHTFRGSFGFEVASQVASQNLTLDLFEAPARRRIVERLTRGLLSLERAVAADSPEIIVEASGGGLNARMCDSLIALAGESCAPYDVTVEWGQAIPPAPDVSQFTSVRIEEPSVEVLAVASEALKRVEPHSQTLRGLVVNLHCTRNPLEGGARRTIEVKSYHSERGTLMIRMSLDPLFYSIAIDAHAKGLEIEATGQLQRSGNTWTLDAISWFTAVGG